MWVVLFYRFPCLTDRNAPFNELRFTVQVQLDHKFSIIALRTDIWKIPSSCHRIMETRYAGFWKVFRESGGLLDMFRTSLGKFNSCSCLFTSWFKFWVNNWYLKIQEQASLISKILSSTIVPIGNKIIIKKFVNSSLHLLVFRMPLFHHWTLVFLLIGAVKLFSWAYSCWLISFYVFNIFLDWSSVVCTP